MAIAVERRTEEINGRNGIDHYKALGTRYAQSENDGSKISDNAEIVTSEVKPSTV